MGFVYLGRFVVILYVATWLFVLVGGSVVWCVDW